MLVLEAANSGQVPVTLRTIPSLLLPDDQQAILISAVKEFDFPYTLLPGTNYHVWKDIRNLATEMRSNGYSGTVNIRGRFIDAVGNSYASRPFPFDVDGWANPA